MEHIATIRRRRRKGGTVEWIARLIYEEAETGRRKELSRSAPSPKEARRRLQELEDDFTERGVAAIGADQMKFSALVSHCKGKRYCELIYHSEGRKLAGVWGRKTFLSHLRILKNILVKCRIELADAWRGVYPGRNSPRNLIRKPDIDS